MSKKLKVTAPALHPENRHNLLWAKGDCGARWCVGAMLSAIPFLAAAILLTPPMAFTPGLVFMVIGFMLLLFPPLIGPHLPKLHWLYGMDKDQRSALEWHEKLTQAERDQLPKGWDRVVREAGTEEFGQSYYGNVVSVAKAMHNAAKGVIDKYREAGKMNRRLDTRVEAHLQLMRERTDALTEVVEDEKIIEAKVRSMP